MTETSLSEEVSFIATLLGRWSFHEGLDGGSSKSVVNKILDN